MSLEAKFKYRCYLAWDAHQSKLSIYAWYKEPLHNKSAFVLDGSVNPNKVTLVDILRPNNSKISSTIFGS